MTLPPSHTTDLDMITDVCVLDAEYADRRGGRGGGSRGGSPRPPSPFNPPSPSRPPRSEGVPSCLKRKAKPMCEIENSCTRDLTLEIGGRIRVDLPSGKTGNYDASLCSQEMVTKSSEGRNVDASACCERRKIQWCKVTNSCGHAMVMERTVGRTIYSIQIDSSEGNFGEEWCEDGSGISARRK